MSKKNVYFWGMEELSPSEHFKKELEGFEKTNPDDVLNKPYESDFMKSGKFNEIIKIKKPIMEARELRIGNYILMDGLIAHVEGFHSAVDEIDISYEDELNRRGYMNDEARRQGEVRPIPLTEKWLIKFGFSKDSDGILKYYNCLYWINNDTLQIALGYAPVINAPCKYVHQLQNLIFALTGTELEIKQSLT